MAVRDFGNQPIVASAGKQTNPTTATVMADTGAIARGGTFQARAVLGASAAAIFDIQRRNAANSANVGPVVTTYVAAGSGGEYIVDFVIEDGERIRVMMNAALTGTAAATLNVERTT